MTSLMIVFDICWVQCALSSVLEVASHQQPLEGQKMKVGWRIEYILSFSSPTFRVLQSKLQTCACAHNLDPKFVENGFPAAYPAIQYIESGRNKEMIGQISFENITSSFFLKFLERWRRKIFGTCTSYIFSLEVMNFDSVPGKFWLNPDMRKSMCFLRAMDSIEVTVFLHLKSHRQLEYSCSWKSFCQLCTQSG